MRKKVFLLIKVIWLTLLLVTTGSGELIAQSITDTIYQIPDVVVSAPRSQHFRDDIKTTVFSQDELSPHAGESLGLFLRHNTSLNLKAYGSGGAVTSLTLRGTSASHVQVNWNGFPINSVTLGSTDFSMIPVTGFDKISIVYGAPGALYGSGTFGGAVNLDNNLKPEKKLGGSLNLSYESIKTASGNASFNIGNNKLAWKVNTWGAISDNEFTYYDYIRQSDRKQTNGDWHDAGVIQQAIIKLSPSSSMEAGLWYQVKAYSIPSRIGSTSYESQRDSSLKFFAAFKKTANRWGLQVKAALFNDEQSYFQRVSAQSVEYSIESHIKALQGYADANLRYYLSPHLSLDAGITGTYITADVSAYGEAKEEKGLSVFTGIKYVKSQLSWQAQVRKEWNTNYHSGILPSLGIAWMVMPDKWTLRANVSQKFRKPTFNDLYWMPGGNPDLKPETGYSIDAGSLVKLWQNARIKLSADLSLYWSEIKDMIAWYPDGVYWVTSNYQRVRSAGMDANLLFDLERERWQYHSSFMVTLNRSVVNNYLDDQERIMLYSPRIITSWENRFSVGILDFTLWHHFTADRFYDFYDENAVLDPYQTFDLQTGIKIPVWKGELGIYVTVNNVTDTSYELIRLYPMPGRYWSVKMNYGF
ncbi:MAG: TonB-dependent receptor [Bacteroidota bacterium]|nr:TonB-dependent receptor [Bacteroidota bacterium]